MHRCLLSITGRRSFFSATASPLSTPPFGIQCRRAYAIMEKKASMAPNAQLTPSNEPFIVRFYRSGARDDEGRTLKDILNFNDNALERHHDYIQVIFPVSISPPTNTSKPLRSQTDHSSLESIFGEVFRYLSFDNNLTVFSFLNVLHTIQTHRSFRRKFARRSWNMNTFEIISTKLSFAWLASTHSMSLETSWTLP